MSNGWLEPPPPQKGMGCFGKGCLILFIFFLVLIVAGVCGTIYGLRYLKTDYFPVTGVHLPASTATEHDQEAARAHWYSFERKARAHAPAQIEMTADELNALIASEPKLRGKAHVSIDGHVARLQVSVPLDEVRLLRGHFLNAECAVQSAADGNPANTRITGIVINGRAVDEEVLNIQYQPWSVRGFLADWTYKNNVKTFEIRDGKVILETKGGD